MSSASQRPQSPGMGGAALRRELAEAPARPPPRDILTSVVRAFEVLELLAASADPLPVKAVASRLGISLGTAYHVMHTLEHGGYVVRLGQGRFGLGGKLTELSRLFMGRLQDVVPVARPHLETLADEAQEDTYLAAMRGGEIVVAEVVERSSNLHCGDLGVGFAEVAHTTALGKVLLAASEHVDVHHYLQERRLARLTPNTLVERRHVKRHLKAVREAGVARDLEEFADGVCCVAFPVVDAAGATVASVGLSVPVGKWRREHERLTRLCAEAARGASEGLRPPLTPPHASERPRPV